MNPDFEKYIRQTLQSHEGQVDAEAIWQNVEPHVRPTKKRRFFWWFFFGLSVGLVAAVVWAYSQNDSPAQKEEHNMTETPTSQGNNNEVEHSVSSNVEKESPAVIDNENIKEKASLNVPLNENENNLSSNATTSNSISSANSKTTRKNTKDTTTKNQNNTNNSKQNKNTVKPNQPNITVGAPQGNVDPTTDKSITTLSSTLTENKTAAINLAVKKLLLPSLMMDAIAVETAYDAELKNADEEGKSLLSKAKLKWAIGGYVGIGRPSPSLESDRDQSIPGYVSNRENTEEQLEWLSFGMSITAQTKKNISFRSGMEYNRIARRFTFRESLAEYDTIPDGILKIYIIPMTNDSIFEKGEVVDTMTQIYDKRTYNYVHRLDVPLMIGYNFEYGNWSIGLELGALANISMKRKGEILNTAEAEETFYDLKGDSKKWYKSNVGLTPLVQMNFNYYLGESMQLSASPYFRFKTVYSTEVNPVKESYSGLGMQVGLRYWFGN